MSFLNRKRYAFTMIELIFVIVIIGIMASIAIPKLSATRDDAKVSAIVNNARVVLGDLQSFYTSGGREKWISAKITEATSVPLQKSGCSGIADDTVALSPNTFTLCNGSTVCLSFTTINEGNLTITSGSSTSDYICEAVKKVPAIIAISNKTYQLAGQAINK